MKNPYIPKKAKITAITNECEEIKTFRIARIMNHEPGQFIEISVLGIGECPISICSSSAKHIDLCIRDVGNVTHAMHNLKKGDSVFIRGPYGHGYPIKGMEGKNLIVIGGGTGTAPLRAVLEHIEKNRKKYREIQVFLGFRSPDSILFKSDMERWKSIFDLNITVDKADKKWKGPVGVVTNLLDNASLNKDADVITCGPPIMIKFAIESLKKKGFNDSQIYVSLERLMHCGIGKCGHCMIGSKYACKDGPVFRHEQVKDITD